MGSLHVMRTVVVSTVLASLVAFGQGHLLAQYSPPGPVPNADQCQCACKVFCTPLDPVRTFYASADLLALKRDVDNHPIEFATRGPSGPAVLGTEDFDIDFQGGMRVTIGQTLNERFRFEGTFFGLHEWTDASAIHNVSTNQGGGTGNLYSALTRFGTVTPSIAGLTLDQNNFASIALESRLNSVELNLRHCLPMPPEPLRVSIIYGIRYMDIEEQFDYLTESSTPSPTTTTNSITTMTNNDLIGLQLGGQAQLRVEERWWFDIDAKGALCTNRARQDTLFVNTATPGAATSFASRAQRDVTAFIGEIGVVLNYEITPRLRTRLGYQAIFVTEVALAEENLARDIEVLTLGPAAVNHEGIVIYHGPSAGITLTW